MLDDRTGGGPAWIEFSGKLECRVGVVDIVVGELLALHLSRRCNAGGDGPRVIEGGALMRVLAIAQAQSELAAESPVGRGGEIHFLREPVRDCRIIHGRPRECFLRELLAQLPRRGAAMRRHFGEEQLVIAGIDDNRDIVVILGGGADHRRAADVDIFDAIVERSAAGDRCLERIKIHDKDIDRRDAMRQHRCLMFGVFPYRQKPAVNFRMQGFHPSVHEFREAGQFGDLADRQTCIGKHLPCAAG